MEFRREVRWEPRPGQMRVRFLLHGPLGATQFLMVFRTKGYENPLLNDELAEGRDVGFHSVAPRSGSLEMEPCDVLPRGICHYDGSGLQGQELGRLFLEKGEPIVWEWLEDRYQTWLVQGD